jgi:hypothetical protein
MEPTKTSRHTSTRKRKSEKENGQEEDGAPTANGQQTPKKKTNNRKRTKETKDDGAPTANAVEQTSKKRTYNRKTKEENEENGMPTTNGDEQTPKKKPNPKKQTSGADSVSVNNKKRKSENEEDTNGEKQTPKRKRPNKKQNENEEDGVYTANGEKQTSKRKRPSKKQTLEADSAGVETAQTTAKAKRVYKKNRKIPDLDDELNVDDSTPKPKSACTSTKAAKNPTPRKRKQPESKEATKLEQQDDLAPDNKAPTPPTVVEPETSLPQSGQGVVTPTEGTELNQEVLNEAPAITAEQETTDEVKNTILKNQEPVSKPLSTAETTGEVNDFTVELVPVTPAANASRSSKITPASPETTTAKAPPASKRTKPKSNRLNKKWEGPFVVTDQKSPLVYATLRVSMPVFSLPSLTIS